MTSTATLEIPARPQARRRPLWLRPVEGPPRAAREPRLRTARRDGHLAPPAAGEGRGRPRPRRAARPVRAARRLRDRARQRRHDRVLGRARAGLDPRAVAAPRPSASSPRSSPRSPRGAPFLADPVVVERPIPAARPSPRDPSCDVVAWAHNETSTGVMLGVERPRRRRPRADRRHLRRRRASRSTPTQADVYYFAPQKSFAADGGLWLAALSPAAVERIERGRGAPTAGSRSSLSLKTALDNSRKDQTYNTPARRDAAGCSPSSSTG